MNHTLSFVGSAFVGCVLVVACSASDSAPSPGAVDASTVSDVPVPTDLGTGDLGTSDLISPDSGALDANAGSGDVEETMESDVLMPPSKVSCTHYCAQVDLVCPEHSPHTVYPNVIECNEYCDVAPWTQASADELAGNSLACRIRIAESIPVGDLDAQAEHCGATGPGGGGQCGDRCAVYCDSVIPACALFGGDRDVCLSTCAGYPVGDAEWATSGDSVQCRSTYAALAGLDFFTGLEFCVNARADSPACTDVAVPPGDTCFDAIDVDSLPFSHSGDTARHTDQLSTEGSCAVGAWRGTTQPDVVYRFTPPTSGAYTVALSGSGAAPSIVYATTDCTDIAGACFDVSGDLATGNTYAFELDADVPVYFVVDGLLFGDFGPYEFSVSGP